MTYRRRKGDTRPFKREEGEPLTIRPCIGQPLRWLPRNGEPLCVLELVSQSILRVLSWWPAYVVLIVTLTLLVQVFGVPFVEGK